MPQTRISPRHFRAGGNPAGLGAGMAHWIPACAGMTDNGVQCRRPAARRGAPAGRRGASHSPRAPSRSVVRQRTRKKPATPGARKAGAAAHPAQSHSASRGPCGTAGQPECPRAPAPGCVLHRAFAHAAQPRHAGHRRPAQLGRIVQVRAKAQQHDFADTLGSAASQTRLIISRLLVWHRPSLRG